MLKYNGEAFSSKPILNALPMITAAPLPALGDTLERLKVHLVKARQIKKWVLPA